MVFKQKHINIQDQKTIFLNISPSTNTQSIYSDKITPYNEATTIVKTLPPFMSKSYFYTKIQSMITQSDQIFESTID